MIVGSVEEWVLMKLIQAAALGTIVGGTIYWASGNVGAGARAAAPERAPAELASSINMLRDQVTLCASSGDGIELSAAGGAQPCGVDLQTQISRSLHEFILKSRGGQQDGRIGYEVLSPSDEHPPVISVRVEIKGYSRAEDSVVIDGLRKVFLRGRVSIDEIERTASFETKFPVFTSTAYQP